MCETALIALFDNEGGGGGVGIVSCHMDELSPLTGAVVIGAVAVVVRLLLMLDELALNDVEEAVDCCKSVTGILTTVLES